MGPAKSLDGDALRANVAAFAARGAPVAAVVKNDGYGWGARALAREIDPLVESYVVNDVDELAALRPATSKPIRLLADVPRGRLAAALALGAIPNVSTAEALAEAAAEAARRGGLTVRVGVVDAGGWAALAPEAVGAFARCFAGTGLAVELWTHVASAFRAAAAPEALIAARRAFEAAGVPIVSVDASATAGAPGPVGDRVRIGIGLFGARMGSAPGLRCALRVVAPIVRRLHAGEHRWAGYGDAAIPPGRDALVLRCGYGDGLPRALAGTGGILSIGMQYTVRLDDGDAATLVGTGDDLDALAARAGIGPHEFVCGLA